MQQDFTVDLETRFERLTSYARTNLGLKVDSEYIPETVRRLEQISGGLAMRSEPELIDRFELRQDEMRRAFYKNVNGVDRQ
jgi:hypothetical protein